MLYCAAVLWFFWRLAIVVDGPIDLCSNTVVLVRIEVDKTLGTEQLFVLLCRWAFLTESLVQHKLGNVVKRYKKTLGFILAFTTVVCLLKVLKHIFPIRHFCIISRILTLDN